MFESDAGAGCDIKSELAGGRSCEVVQRLILERLRGEFGG
jgi:hypothetical protein